MHCISIGIEHDFRETSRTVGLPRLAGKFADEEAHRVPMVGCGILKQTKPTASGQVIELPVPACLYGVPAGGPSSSGRCYARSLLCLLATVAGESRGPSRWILLLSPDRRGAQILRIDGRRSIVPITGNSSMPSAYAIDANPALRKPRSISPVAAMRLVRKNMKITEHHTRYTLLAE